MTTYSEASPTSTIGARAGVALDALRSEISKIQTVRSTYWALGTAVASNIVLGALAAFFIPGALSAQDIAAVDPVRLSLAGIHLSQVAFGVFGALAITSEFTTGTMRATLAAVPMRRLVLAAKATAFTLVALPTALAASFAGYFAFQLALTDSRLESSLSDTGVLRAVAGGGLFLTVLGLLGLGLGIVIRSSAGTIAALLGILFVPSILVGLLPQAWQSVVGPYLPMEAGSAIFMVNNHGSGSLDPWTGMGVFCAYAVGALVAGFVVIRHRDV